MIALQIAQCSIVLVCAGHLYCNQFVITLAKLDKRSAGFQSVILITFRRIYFGEAQFEFPLTTTYFYCIAIIYIDYFVSIFSMTCCRP